MAQRVALRLRPTRLTFILLSWIVLSGCEREQRTLRLDPAIAEALDSVRLMPNKISGAPPEVYVALSKPYANNAYDLAQGKRLYSWFGCPRCHGQGEGGIGPAFLDGRWQYGADIVSIFSSIRDGRPHGMPPFKEEIPTEQIWQLAGYVQAIGSYTAKTAYPGRNDDKQTRPAENRAPAVAAFHILPEP